MIIDCSHELKLCKWERLTTKWLKLEQLAISTRFRTALVLLNAAGLARRRGQLQVVTWEA